MKPTQPLPQPPKEWLVSLIGKHFAPALMKQEKPAQTKGA